jgi:hypothetical protein
MIDSARSCPEHTAKRVTSKRARTEEHSRSWSWELGTDYCCCLKRSERLDSDVWQKAKKVDDNTKSEAVREQFFFFFWARDEEKGSSGSHMRQEKKRKRFMNDDAEQNSVRPIRSIKLSPFSACD